ncbi:hypothetical protein [Clostridium sp. YIM B02555]|uniref:hypothetical protein n=1 Tax=Clostridium sp. YIM B02555 TaxID=2911968 RepID=UPI001EEECBD5|nr:hypothetical protein [Clostridium sp. YIM B02555]
MKKTKIELLAVVAILTTVIGTTSIPAFATTTTTNGTLIESSIKNNTLTKDSYISWFNEKIKKSTGSEKADLKTALSQFKALTKEKQDKFIEYLNNPEIMSNAIKTANNAVKQEVKKSSLSSLNSSSQSTSNKVFKYNDDIKVTVSSNVEDTDKSNKSNSISKSSYGDAQEHKVTGTYKDAITLFDVDVFQAIIWVKYTHNGDEVLSVDDGNAYTGKNYSPLLDTNWSDVSLDYNSQKAWATSDVTFSLIWKGLGVKYGSAELGVQGDVNKNIEGWTTPQ